MCFYPAVHIPISCTYGAYEGVRHSQQPTAALSGPSVSHCDDALSSHEYHVSSPLPLQTSPLTPCCVRMQELQNQLEQEAATARSERKKRENAERMCRQAAQDKVCSNHTPCAHACLVITDTSPLHIRYCVDGSCRQRSCHHACICAACSQQVLSD